MNRKILNDKNLKLIHFGKTNVLLEKKNKSFALRINNHIFNIKKLQQNTNLELENLECAIACCMVLNFSEKKIIKILPEISNPPGRYKL